MRYYEQDERRGRKWGIAGAALYAAVCAGVMFVTYTIVLPDSQTGILVDFGTADTGFGDTDLSTGEVATATSQPEATDVPPITAADPEVTVPDRRQEEPVVPAPEPIPVREADRRALFPGRTEGGAATSQGNAGGEGNQGAADGSPQGSDSAGGTGASGFSLAGRYLVGNLPRPAYEVEVEGRVVIRITVGADGAVTGAVYEQAGSTTNHGELVRAARAAAMKARFTPGDADVQTGTITYIFRLN